MKDTCQTIRDRYGLLTALQEQLKKKIGDYPEGRIRIKRDPYSVYYIFVDKSGKDIRTLGSDDAALIEDLMQKSYLQKVLRSSEIESDYLGKVLKRYPFPTPEDIYAQLNGERKKHVRPIILPDDQFIRQWEEKPFEHKPFKEGAPYYETIRGERVRSKSEQIIADRLHAKKIPYRYECPLKVGKDIIHPDFTILRMSDRKELYLEHCGKMDDPGYSQDMVIRMNRYALAGIHQGEKLFLTYESSSSPFDVRVLDRMIEDLFR
ncbi:MAG: hypothetical protein IKN14_09260 [Clostridiales bacterium]|nr:hypothetical protein [Clostridiales bacterium]